MDFQYDNREQKKKEYLVFCVRIVLSFKLSSFENIIKVFLEEIG